MRRSRIFIRSTAPNLVGNDAWGAEDNIRALYGVECVGDLSPRRRSMLLLAGLIAPMTTG
jgi:hypothetical protein